MQRQENGQRLGSQGVSQTQCHPSTWGVKGVYKTNDLMDNIQNIGYNTLVTMSFGSKSPEVRKQGQAVNETPQP